MGREDHSKKGQNGDRGRGARTPTQIPARGWRDIAIRTWKESSDDNVGIVSAGVAFYAFLALVPLLGAIVLTYGLIADPASVVEQARGLFNLLPPDAAKLIGEEMISIVSQSAGRTGLGLAAAIALSLYGAMRGAGALILGINIAYDEHETRGFIKTSLISLAATVGAVAVAIVAVLAVGALGYLDTLFPAMPVALRMMIRIAFWVAAAVSASLAIAILYRYGPDRDAAKWRWLSPGALFATVAWVAVTLGFGLYTANFANYNATYGALGAVVVLLMWLYLSAYVLILGAELNAEIEHQTERDTTRGPARPIGQRDAEMADTVGEVPESVFPWGKHGR